MSAPHGLLSGDTETIKIFLFRDCQDYWQFFCTGIGMSVAGLIMQQLCMNKFVSPSTGATISSAQFGILIALIFMPGSPCEPCDICIFSAILVTWIFVAFIQRIQFKDVVMVPLVGIMFGNVVT